MFGHLYSQSQNEAMVRAPILVYNTENIKTEQFILLSEVLIFQVEAAVLA